MDYVELFSKSKLFSSYSINDLKQRLKIEKKKKKISRLKITCRSRRKRKLYYKNLK